MRSAEQPVIWYREPWPWILMGIPMVSVILGVVMLWLATTTNNSMVVDDYYRKGKAIDVDVSRDHVASEMGLSATVFLADKAATVKVTTHDTKQLLDLPKEISVRFVHSAFSEMDRSFIATVSSGSTYHFTLLKPIASGRYRTHLESPRGDWRLVSQTLHIEDARQENTQEVVITSDPIITPSNLPASG